MHTTEKKSRGKKVHSSSYRRGQICVMTKSIGKNGAAVKNKPKNVGEGAAPSVSQQGGRGAF